MERVLTQSGSADEGGFCYAPSSDKPGSGAASHVPVAGKDVSSGYRQQPRNTGPRPPFKRVICYHCVEAGYIQPRSTKRKPAVTPMAVQLVKGPEVHDLSENSSSVVLGVPWWNNQNLTSPWIGVRLFFIMGL
ncbi:hypothetical protein Pcinc_042486 [Petrolisthes cinctipes]|uniref:Uncharacterized protein n=1 Tax=Petrolisthes cinctipes TaxID=88211 RepID=A0AAE1BKK6_PETCI|nr:hypothetical protein Pcinc_042486 [Petrolisthes cinctipes]